MSSKTAKDEKYVNSSTQLLADALRWRFLSSTGTYLMRCETRRQGYRATGPGATWEIWYEFDGWLTNQHSVHHKPFETMEGAVNDAIEITKWEEGGAAEKGDEDSPFN